VFVNARWGYEAATTVISVKIPAAFIDGIDKLIYAGLFQSRSDALREAIRLLLMKYSEVVFERKPKHTTG
jgi:Arc/MetJ-type ribon-helix-helix transcriptional regulator